MRFRSAWRTAFSLVVGAGLCSGVFAKPKPTSVIPERREFPVNPAVSPCTDFFEHACSEAIAGFELREDRSKHIFSFSDSHERVLEAKKKFLASLPGMRRLSPRAQSLANIYSACMNDKASAVEERETVDRIKKEVASIPDRAAFQKFLTSKMLETEYSFIDWGNASNLDDSDWEDIYFLSDVLSLPEKSYYQKKDIVADLEKLARETFSAAGVDKPAERAKWVIAFEKEAAKSFPTPAELREVFNSKTEISREKMLKTLPTFQLATFFSEIPARTKIRDLTPKNFAWLETALAKKDLETLKSVYLFHSLPSYMDDAYPEYFKKAFEFNRKHLGGPNVRPVRQERCTMYVMDKFTKEIDAELLPTLFPGFAEAKLVALVEKVRASIIRGIQSNDWLSDKSKKAAVHKIEVAHLQLVKPRTDAEWDFNPSATYSTEKRYANNRLLAKNLQEKAIRELAQKRDRSRWEMGPLTVNAYYSPSDNKFVMPIGILQYPFYDAALPDAMNLGAVGMVVGHELGHGIDDHGARYDEMGRMIQWMDDKDVKEFISRGKRLVKLFDKAGQNGPLTLGENIGDLVGLTFAFNAAFPDGKGTVEEKKNFFLQYARAWCGVIRPKFKEMLIKTDPHALMFARVNEQVKHQPAFQEAFGCKAGDKMVLPAKERVRIW